MQSIARRVRQQSRVAVGIGIAVVLAVIIALVAHAILNPPESRYTIDPQQVALSLADVGAQQYSVVDTSDYPPTPWLLSHAGSGPFEPFEGQYYKGWRVDFYVTSVLTPQAEAEIGQWQAARGFQPTDPPTIFGPYVAEHTGIFEIVDAEQSYHTASAAHDDFVCCTAGKASDYAANYDGWHALSIQVGDETYAWSGIRDTPANCDDYEELVYFIHWRHGSVDSTIWIFGAHDVTSGQMLTLARLVDSRIARAL